MIQPVLCLAALSIVPAVARAGELDQTRLPADAQWVLHLDLETLRTTKLGSHLMELVRAHEGDADLDIEELDEIWKELQVDPLQDVRSVTVHGTGGEDAVAQIRMSKKADEILAKLSQVTRVHQVAVGDLSMLAIGDSDDELFAFVQKTSADERTIVLADDAERVAHTAKVLLGKAPNLKASGASAFARGPSAGTWLFVATRSPLSKITDFDPTSHVAELVQGGVLELGEKDETFFASLEVDARSNDDARRLASIVQGGLALLELATGDEEVPESAREMLRALSVEQLGTGVKLSVRLPAQELIQMLDELEREASK
jgi:hypothetical protein